MEEIKEEEVIDAIWALDLDKESGLDGFSISFYSSSWFLIEEVLIRMLHWARIKGKLGRGIFFAFLTLKYQMNKILQILAGSDQFPCAVHRTKL